MNQNQVCCAVILLGAFVVLGCGTSSTPGPDAGDASMGQDVGMDVGTEDGGVDAMSCPPVSCDQTAGCRSYVVDGCESCYCPPASECAEDSDCVLATLTGICCGGCIEAFPRSAAEGEVCVVELYTPTHPECMGIGCEAIDCPAIACAFPARAVCNAGMCRTESTCAPGDVMTGFGCAPRCTADMDCSVRTNTANCCPACEEVMHNTLADSLSCFFTSDQSPGAECLPDGESCRELACPDIACREVGGAFCDVDTGLCETQLLGE